MQSFEAKGVARACVVLAAIGGAIVPAAAQDLKPVSRPDQKVAAAQPPADRNTRTSPPAEDPVPLDEAANDSDGTPGGPVTRRSSRRDEKPYRFEIGVTPRYVSNYFQAQDEFDSIAESIPPQDVFITTLSGRAEYDLLQRPGSTLTAGLRVRRNLVSELRGADSTEIDVTLDYNFRPNQLRFGYFRTPRRLASVVDGRNIYSEINGFSAEYLRRVTDRLRARAGYQIARETFSEFQQRDATRHLLSGDVRYQIDPLFSPGIGVEYLRSNAGTENQSFERIGYSFLVNSRIDDVAYLTFRYRRSNREFDTDLPTDSNFAREDKRDDFSFYGTFQLGGGFSLFGFASHTDSNSNRDTRDFTNYEAGLGLFYRFP